MSGDTMWVLAFYISITLLGFAAGMYFVSRSRAHQQMLETEWSEYSSKRHHEEILNRPSIHENWPIYADDGSILTLHEFNYLKRKRQPTYPDGGNIYQYGETFQPNPQDIVAIQQLNPASDNFWMYNH